LIIESIITSYIIFSILLTGLSFDNLIMKDTFLHIEYLIICELLNFVQLLQIRQACYLLVDLFFYDIELILIITGAKPTIQEVIIIAIEVVFLAQ